MRILELDLKKQLKSADSTADFYAIARKYGWKPLGRGLYGAVFEHPNKNYVIKVFYRNRSYEKFVDFVLENSTNPHLPKISKNIRAVPGTDLKYVGMENLEPVSEETLRTKYFPELAYMVVKIAKFDLHAPDDVEDFVSQQLQELGLEFDSLRQVNLSEMFDMIHHTPDPSWQTIVDKLVKYADNTGENYFDIHYENFMLRNNTLIITDPF